MASLLRINQRGNSMVINGLSGRTVRGMGGGREQVNNKKVKRDEEEGDQQEQW